MIQLLADRIPSPIGEIVLVAEGGRLCAIDYDDCAERLEGLLRRRYGPFALVSAADPWGFSATLRAYLGGDLTSLDAIPVSTGGTPFQQEVWRALRAIPPGTTRSYGQLATRLGRPRGARAVGLANSQNPISIVVPCHRLVGADAALTGYAGGLTRKAWLLAHEGAPLAARQRESAL